MNRGRQSFVGIRGPKRHRPLGRADRDQAERLACLDGRMCVEPGFSHSLPALAAEKFEPESRCAAATPPTSLTPISRTPWVKFVATLRSSDSSMSLRQRSAPASSPLAIARLWAIRTSSSVTGCPDGDSTACPRWVRHSHVSQGSGFGPIDRARLRAAVERPLERVRLSLVQRVRVERSRGLALVDDPGVAVDPDVRRSGDPALLVARHPAGPRQPEGLRSRRPLRPMRTACSPRSTRPRMTSATPTPTPPKDACRRERRAATAASPRLAARRGSRSWLRVSDPLSS